jgi:hypothetical protein
MNKDTVVASLIGFGLGLVAAIVLWVVPRILPSAPKSPPKTSEVASVDVKGDANPPENFTVTSHKDGDVLKTADMTLEGRAQDTELVVVSTADTTAVVKPTQNLFKTPVTLKTGANHIVVTRLTKDVEESKTLFIYFYEDLL